MTALVAAPSVATAVATAGAEAIAEAGALADVVRNAPLLGLTAAGLAAGAVLVLLGGSGDRAAPGHETPGAPVDPSPTGPRAPTAPTHSTGSTTATRSTQPTGSTRPTRSTHPTGSMHPTRPTSAVGSRDRSPAAGSGGLLPAPAGGKKDDGRGATDAEVSSALALLALAYRSGLPTWDVLEAVATGLTGRASTDLRQVAAALRWGATEADAWASVGHAWSPAARAVAIAHQAGVPPGSMLLAASDDLHSAELERLEVSAAKVGVRLVAPLGLVLLPAFCLTTVAPLVIALAGSLLAD